MIIIQGSLVQGLKGRFKERRRTKKPRTATKSPSEEADHKPHPPKGPALKALELPPIPAGEDDTSFERHNRILKLEYAKPHPNNATVTELMKTTFAMRRRDILSEGHKFDIGKYPFLQSPYHVSMNTVFLVKIKHKIKNYAQA